MSDAENPHLLRCHVCGETLVVFERGNESPEIGCLNCLASNDADKVAEDGAGLISGLLTAEQAQDLREQAVSNARAAVTLSSWSG
jgi:hypothetical protein